MATFTMALKDVIEDTGGTLEIVDGISKLTGGNIGLSDYPIFNEAYRDILNGKIIDHFMNCEIGLETVGMFQLAMRRKMNIIMPYFNKLYESELVALEPLKTIDVKTVATGNVNQEAESEANSNSSTNARGDSRSVTSDTPQMALSGSGDYATGIADVISTNSNASTGAQSNNESQNTESETESTTTGYQGSPADLLLRFRDTFINIDLSIINEIENDGLFMLVWGNNDRYFSKGLAL